MNYLLFIWAEGMPAADELANLQREIPGWVQEMDGRGVRLFGRELDLPETAVTVRVRGGDTLISDGPFSETKEFVAGFDLLECEDPEEAIEVAAACPISWIQSTEVRPFSKPLQLGETAGAFAREERENGTPYALIGWRDGSATAQSSSATDVDSGAWRDDLQARGLHVLGNPLGGPETATTVRVRAGERHLHDGPPTESQAFIAELDVINCSDRREAIQLAAAHPIAREGAVEVRPFYVP